MKTIYKNQNCRAMTPEGVLAIICGTLLALVLILHFQTAGKSTPQKSSDGISNKLTADAITITESQLDSAMVEMSVHENTNEIPEPLILTNTARAANDIGLSAAQPTEMRLPPAKRQRIQVPPNARWAPTNMGRPAGPGVPIAFP